VYQVTETEIGETKTLALLEAGLASPQTTTMNYGSLSTGEGAWWWSSTGARQVIRRNLQKPRFDAIRKDCELATMQPQL